MLWLDMFDNPGIHVFLDWQIVFDDVCDLCNLRACVFQCVFLSVFLCLCVCSSEYVYV